jgi:hypothetical protein
MAKLLKAILLLEMEVRKLWLLLSSRKKLDLIVLLDIKDTNQMVSRIKLEICSINSNNKFKIHKIH